MFFGLTNSPATFQAMMNAIFREEILEGWLTVYMDDMLIATSDDTKFHQKCVHRILHKLRQNDLYLKPEKCFFHQKKIEFLGVILENGQVQMDPAKIKGVAEWPQPQNVRDVRAFLGFTGFYRYFVEKYSEIARPLINLTKKNEKFHWEDDQRVAFERLKLIMCQHPVLRQPDYTKPFFVSTDASSYGLGGVLFQEGPLNPKTKKPTHNPVAYYSATFTPTERNYDIYERELLAVIKTLKNWRPHLAATLTPVTILTDHANLQYWKVPRKINRRVARWMSDLQDYNLTIKHVPGKTHAAADMLSRPPGSDHGKDDNQDVTLLPPKIFVNQIKTLSEDDKRKILQQYHDAPTTGHPGRDNTIQIIKRHHQWQGMEQWITKYVQGCAHCQQNKVRHQKRTPLFRINVPIDATPFQVIAMDLITQLPPSNGYDAILTIVDHGCTRAAVFLPCKTTITGEEVAQLYLRHIYRWFGLPNKVISDRDPRFTSNFSKALCAALQIQQNISTAFHPQTDGLTERKNQWVEQYLRLFAAPDQTDWDQWLDLATFVHNQWPNGTTKVTPIEAILGYIPRGTGTEKETPNQTIMERQLQAIKWRKRAEEALNKIAGSPPDHQYTEGDLVWLEGKNLTIRTPTAKLAPKRYGPFTITKRISPVAYQLQLPIGWTIHNVFHASLLTPYRQTKEHGTNFTRPPPDVIAGEEEFEVEGIINHRYYGRSKGLQYLIKWKGYPHADNTWEPADQVHAPKLTNKYHQRKASRSIKTRVLLTKSACPQSSFRLLEPLLRRSRSSPKNRSLQSQGTPSTFDSPQLSPVSPLNQNSPSVIFGSYLERTFPRVTSPNTPTSVNTTTAPFTTKCLPSTLPSSQTPHPHRHHSWYRHNPYRHDQPPPSWKPSRRWNKNSYNSSPGPLPPPSCLIDLVSQHNLIHKKKTQSSKKKSHKASSPTMDNVDSSISQLETVRSTRGKYPAMYDLPVADRPAWKALWESTTPSTQAPSMPPKMSTSTPQSNRSPCGTNNYWGLAVQGTTRQYGSPNPYATGDSKSKWSGSMKCQRTWQSSSDVEKKYKNQSRALVNTYDDLNTDWRRPAPTNTFDNSKAWQHPPAGSGKGRKVGSFEVGLRGGPNKWLSRGAPTIISRRTSLGTSGGVMIPAAAQGVLGQRKYGGTGPEERGE
jgi:hypothetical protein